MRGVFWKGFFRVLILLLGVVIIIHGGVFFTLSKSYLEEKTKEIKQTAADVTKNLAGKIVNTWSRLWIFIQEAVKLKLI